MQCSRFIGQADTGIGDRLYTVTINDGKEYGPQAIRCSIDGFLIAKFIQVIRLAWLVQGDRRIAGTVQGDIVMVGDVAQELPFGPGQTVINGRAPAHTEICS